MFYYYTNTLLLAVLIARSQTKQLVTKTIVKSAASTGHLPASYNNWESKRFNSTLVSFKTQSLNSSLIFKTLYFNQPQLNLILTRNYSDKPQDSKTVADPKGNKTEDQQVAAATKKKSWGQWLKEEVLHYWHGFKLLGLETRVSSKLLWKMATGYELSRREQRQVINF